MGHSGKIKLNFDFDSPAILKSPLFSPAANSERQEIQNNRRRVSVCDQLEETHGEKSGLMNLIGKRKSSGSRHHSQL